MEYSRAEIINFKEELEIIQLYTSIEKTRMKVPFVLRIKVEEGLILEKIRLPSMILQPFVENAIWHGLSQKLDDKLISIKVFKDEFGYTNLHIEDNGVGRKVKQHQQKDGLMKKKSLGLLITSERLDYFNQKEEVDYRYKIVDLFAKDNSSKGTRVEFI